MIARAKEMSIRVLVEQTVLGMCLLENGYSKVSDILSPVNFSSPDIDKGIYFSHGEIFSAFEKLYPIKPINLVSVIGMLGYESMWYIFALSSRVCSSSDIRYHAFQLLEFSIRESFLSLLTKLSEGKTDITAVAIHEIIDEALDYDNDIFEVIKTAITYLQKIDSNAVGEAIDFHNKIDLKVSRIKQLASVDALMKNLTNLNQLTNDTTSQMAITHLTDLVKTILTKGQITNNELTQILNTSL
jgi:hypothetical protein